MYCTLDSWSSERRVIGKAEVINGKKPPAPRYIVTEIEASEDWAQGKVEYGDRKSLYEKIYPSPSLRSLDSHRPGLTCFDLSGLINADRSHGLVQLILLDQLISE